MFLKRLKIKKRLARFKASSFLRSSLVMFIGGTLGSFGNYLFHLVMGRRLGPADYGALSSVISIFYFFTIPLVALNLFVVKKTSSWQGQGKTKKISAFRSFLYQRIFYWILGLLIFSFLISGPITRFLHLNSFLPALLVIVSATLDFFLTVNSSVLTAFLKFGAVSLLKISQSGLKLLVGLGLVSLGLGLQGATASFLFGSLLALGVSFIFLGWPKRRKRVVEDEKSLADLWPYLVLAAGYTSLYMIDVFLARHFLTSFDSGLYASLATLGKIIPFAVAPIGVVMFPVVTQKKAAGEDYQTTFKMGLLIIGGACFVAIGAYTLFPKLVIGLLFGAEYLGAATALPLVAIFLSFYALANYLSQYLISIGSQKEIYLPLMGTLIQIVSIFLFHQSISQILIGCLLGSGFVLLGLVIRLVKK